MHIQIKGALDVSRLQAALNGLSQRHTALLARLATAPGYRGLRQFFEAGAANVALAVDESSDTTQVLVQWCQRPVSLASRVFFEGLLQRIDAQHWQLTLGLAGFVGIRRAWGFFIKTCVRRMSRAAVPWMRNWGSLPSTWSGMPK